MTKRSLKQRIRWLLYWLWQWTWGLPQNLAGAVLTLCTPGRREWRGGALVTWYPAGKLHGGGLSLGMFLFVPGQSADRERICVHEYGHAVQSLLFGPAYFLLVGLPSALRAARFDRLERRGAPTKEKYSARWPENGANRMGERFLGGKAIDW